MSIKLSVVIPAYNEEENIAQGALSQVYDYLHKQKYSWELVIVDDGSSDNTAQVAETFAKKDKKIRVLREPHRGKGGTVIAGILKSLGDIVLFTDMDQATPLSEVEKFFPVLEEGYELAIGVRSGRKGAPLIRKAMAYGFTLLRTLILGLPYKDTQCGFKAFRRKAAQNIFKKMEVYSEKHTFEGASVTAGFDLEMLYIARKLGYRVAEVPVIWIHKDTERVNPVKDSVQGFRDLLRVRMNAYAGRYNV